jgi:Bacterial Ig-like domain (group 3)
MGRILRLAAVCGTVACCVLAAGGATARASEATGAAVSRPAAASGSGGSWDAARQVPGLAALILGQGAQATALSCPAAGDCGLGGTYAGDNAAFVADEKAGTWRKAEAVAGIFGIGDLSSLSCGAPGNCAAAGFSGEGEAGGQAVIADEVNGAWQAAFAVNGTTYDSGPASEFDAMSCPASGYCVGGGYSDDDSIGPDEPQAYIVEETRGSWGTAFEIPGTVALNTGGYANVTSISCASKGNCAAGGYYSVSVDAQQAFVATERNGRWATAVEVPGSAALNAGGSATITAVSCAAGYCAAIGSYTDAAMHNQAFLVTARDGTWGTAQEIANAALNAVSCPAIGDCAVVGSYADAAGHQQAFVMTQKNGAWQPEQELAGALNTGGNAAADSIACPAVGDCAAGGSYADAAGHRQAFLVIERDGAWQPARETAAALNTGGSAAVAAVSCPSVSSCAAAGNYTGTGSATAGQVFVVTGAIIQPTSTRLALSAASVPYGHEQSEKISVTVAPRYGGTPPGTVRVRAGHVTVCLITLASGAGSCRLTARRLHRGSYRLTAAYEGGPGFLGSVSAVRTLTVY